MDLYLCLMVGLLVIILVIIYFRNKYEHFEGPLKEITHVVVGQDCKPIFESPQQPSGNGISGCAVIPCPQKKEYDNRTVCWSCCNYDDSSYKMNYLI